MPISLISAASVRPNHQSKRGTSARLNGHDVVPIIACPSVLLTKNSPFCFVLLQIRSHILTDDLQVATTVLLRREAKVRLLFSSCFSRREVVPFQISVLLLVAVTRTDEKEDSMKTKNRPGLCRTLRTSYVLTRCPLSSIASLTMGPPTDSEQWLLDGILMVNLRDPADHHRFFHR
jgi:hypothetical protein